MNIQAFASAQTDSVVVESPLPGGVATVVRFLFQSVPQWMQAGGVVIGVLMVGALGYLAWRSRDRIVGWLITRSRALKITLAAVVAVVVLAGGTMGKVSWDYVQHDNGFCTGCHVMEDAFVRFSQSGHNELNCHDCHQQPISASMWQLYLWVAERPEQIGEHAPVANAVCERCHVAEGAAASEGWSQIAATAGHRTHLESDSTKLADVQCVTCHGQEIHQFLPVDETCASSDCHVSSDVALGAMAEQTSLHCVTCHQFTVEVPLLATRDSAAGTLTPAVDQCLGCHQMQTVLAEFDANIDPHGGTCGMCHNPHDQESAEDARTTCEECHDDWRNRPFHVGPQHESTAQRCGLCHEPHRSLVDASDCVGCHEMVMSRPDTPPAIRERLQRAAPFDTTQVLRTQGRLLEAPLTSPGVDWVLQRHGFWGIGTLPTGPPGPTRLQLPTPLPADSFPHDRHETLSCLTCHTTSSGHGALTFEEPRGCQICHHDAPDTLECAACHDDDSLTPPTTVSVVVEVDEHPPRTAPVDFLHREHGGESCITCHVTPISLETEPPVAGCIDCHGDHHAAARDCAACHAGPGITGAHERPVNAHVQCDTCHDASTIATLVPDRRFCITCHQSEADHYAERSGDAGECTTCHFLLPPEDFRSALSTAGGRR